MSDNFNAYDHDESNRESHDDWLDDAFRDDAAPTGDWLDDAFDERKTKQDLAEAQHSGRMGCLLAVVLIIVIIGSCFCFFGMMGALNSLNGTL